MVIVSLISLFRAAEAGEIIIICWGSWFHREEYMMRSVWYVTKSFSKVSKDEMLNYLAIDCFHRDVQLKAFCEEPAARQKSSRWKRGRRCHLDLTGWHAPKLGH